MHQQCSRGAEVHSCKGAEVAGGRGAEVHMRRDAVVLVQRSEVQRFRGAYVQILYVCTQFRGCKNPVSGKRSFDFGTYGNIVPWIKRGGFQVEASQTT